MADQDRAAADPDRKNFPVHQIGFDFEAARSTHLDALMHRPAERSMRFDLQRR